MRTVVLAAAFLLMNGYLVAQSEWKADGSSLLAKCSLAVRAFDGEKLSSAETVDGMMCLGYILGVRDADFMVQKLEEHDKITLLKHACVPDNASTAQVARTVVKYLRDNPERLNWPAAILVTDAIRNAFLCA